ncbi:hypothetical protein C7H19_17145 [Aphanothece hegewaldii CCALA 016]|uniref:Uncharacterized protein n=1 Tax=Aphanothece hegewaldii CCALA 016 TaxID=2107694 RepID=A0A2T1LUP9_9CHRO|nr:hypothetical protein [Aphanothece hegewaldii]PSF35284.1 hypothetical protein C7H19_17145 [Aphanothece hegewaldii CCALA 016]
MLFYKNKPIWRLIILLLLMPAIYSVFGWTIAQESDSWNRWLIDGRLLEKFNIFLDERIAHKLLYGLSLLLILTLTLGLTIFDRSLLGLLGSCFKSDITAIIAVLIWSLALALIICFFNYFAEFLLLLNAAILGRLELQEAGYNNWQVCTILTAICVCSFAIGLLGFDWWRYTMSITQFSLILNYIKIY